MTKIIISIFMFFSLLSVGVSAQEFNKEKYDAFVAERGKEQPELGEYFKEEFTQIQQLANAQKYDEALLSLDAQDIQAMCPSEAIAHTELYAAIYIRQEKYDLAIEKYIEITENPNTGVLKYVAAHSKLSDIYRFIKNYPKSIEHAYEALQYEAINPAALLLNSSNLNAEMGNYDEALKNISIVEAYFNLAMTARDEKWIKENGLMIKFMQQTFKRLKDSILEEMENQ